MCSRVNCPFAEGECSSDTACVGKMKLDAALNTHFKFPFFRRGQLDALLPVMHGKDVFVRMATGAGKSLCMFLVPLAISVLSLGIVTSPLNALMDQQV